LVVVKYPRKRKTRECDNNIFINGLQEKARRRMPISGLLDFLHEETDDRRRRDVRTSERTPAGNDKTSASFVEKALELN
jgi:hypothetical protein